MDTGLPNHSLLPTGVPVLLLWLIAAVAAGLWIRSHVWSRQLSRAWLSLAFPLRIGLGFLTLIVAAQAAQRHITLATNWPLWPILLLGAALVEAVLALYQLERHTVARKAGIALPLLRVLLVLAVIAMLCQPVLILETSRRIQRHVAVLLDQSASMQVPDNGLTPAEKIRLAEALAIPGVTRTWPIDRLASALRDAEQDLIGQADWLNAISDSEPTERARELSDRAERCGGAHGVRRSIKPVCRRRLRAAERSR